MRGTSGVGHAFAAILKLPIPKGLFCTEVIRDTTTPVQDQCPRYRLTRIVRPGWVGIWVHHQPTDSPVIGRESWIAKRRLPLHLRRQNLFSRIRYDVQPSSRINRY